MNDCNDMVARGHPAPIGELPCDQEPIHIPGAIQPSGAMVAALADTMVVTHASANLAAFLGRTAESVLGKPLANVIGDAAARALRDADTNEGTVPGQLPVIDSPDGSAATLHAFRSGRHVCIDIEPLGTAPALASPAVVVRSVLETFRHAGSRQELCEFAVRGTQGVDRLRPGDRLSVP